MKCTLCAKVPVDVAQDAGFWRVLAQELPGGFQLQPQGPQDTAGRVRVEASVRRDDDPGELEVRLQEIVDEVAGRILADRALVAEIHALKRDPETG